MLQHRSWSYHLSKKACRKSCLVFLSFFSLFLPSFIHATCLLFIYANIILATAYRYWKTKKKTELKNIIQNFHGIFKRKEYKPLLCFWKSKKTKLKWICPGRYDWRKGISGGRLKTASSRANNIFFLLQLSFVFRGRACYRPLALSTCSFSKKESYLRT